MRRHQGDCDTDADCAGALVCNQNVGASYGARSDLDVCDYPLGNVMFCSTTYPCTHGQGDCDSDAECANGSICVHNVGAAFGFDPAIDVCL